MWRLEANVLAKRLEALYGLPLVGSSDTYDGGAFFTIRPIEPPRPNGFAIQIAHTPARIEAVFRPDAYSKRLMQSMSEADESSRQAFAALFLLAKRAGIRTTVLVDGDVLEDPALLPASSWTKLELDCDSRVPGRRASDDERLESAVSVASACLGLVLSLLPTEEISETLPSHEAGLPEGAKVRVEVNRYERSPVNRAVCLARYGFSCQVCGLSFADRYGDLGADFIEVHHRVPVSAMGGSYVIDPLRDLVPVCCNCHAMLHRVDPPLTLDDLRRRLVPPREA
jgi:5-methylcytosine-specific restriction protein A